MKFFTGLHQVSDAKHFDASLISINRLIKRKSDFAVKDWILDSGAFSRIANGQGHLPQEEYLKQIVRWDRCGNLLAAVSQDWMCEPFVVKKTGLSVAEHQRMTVRRFIRLRVYLCARIYLMPVLQGYEREEYLSHIDQYGRSLKHGAWVGVGSICKRNGNPQAVADILLAIKRKRPDLRLHGFGLKATSLQNSRVRMLLYSADSMAWSFSARKQGRDGNDWREADSFRKGIENPPSQSAIDFLKEAI